jgi:CRISPR/Cas system-associated exonuclease Cas4 (RecB family)
VSAHNSAVVNGELRHISASQIKTFTSCQRRWWAEKIAGWQAPPNGSFALGTAIHGQMEAFVELGTLPAHPSALKAASDLPLRSPHAFVELKLTDPTISVAGVPFKGSIDWVEKKGGEVSIIDYKSTSGFSWNKSPDELARDVQLLTYATWAKQKWPDVEKVKVAHVYLLTKDGSGYRVVDTEVDWDVAANVWKSVEAVVTEMKATAKLTQLADVKPNWKDCFSYGKPCPWTDKCAAAKKAGPKLTFAELLDGETNTMTKPPETGSTTSTAPVEQAKAIKTMTDAFVAHSTRPLDGLELYVDCVSVKGDGFSQQLEDIIATKAAEVCKDEGVVDIRLVNYGKGPGLLAAKFRADPPKGKVFAASGALSSPVIEVLVPLASVVVRGVRS